MKKLREIAVPALLLVIALLLIPQRARSVYSSPVSVVNPDVQSAAVNDAPRQVVEYHSFNISICAPANSFHADQGLTVPAGKSLVVDNVSGFMGFSQAGDRGLIIILPLTGAAYTIPLQFQFTYNGTDYWNGNARTHMVLPAGLVTIQYFKQNLSAGCAFPNFTISGHLIDQ